jgi:methylglyoxal synthase
MSSTRILKKVKRIALVAHDNKKKDLMEWASFNKKVLSKHELFATGTTGNLLEKEIDTTITKLLSGPLGGDQQMGAMIAEGKLDIVIFFWDPMSAQAHDSDVKALLRIAVAWNVIIACNRTTADFVLSSSLMNDDHPIDIPDYSKYLGRSI